MGWSEYILGDRLVTNISFPEANFKNMEPLGVRKARCDALWRLLCVGDEGVIVTKIKIVRKMPMFWPKIYPSCFQAILHLEGCARNCKMSLSAEIMQDASIVITFNSSVNTKDSFPGRGDHPNSSIDVANIRTSSLAWVFLKALRRY